jgi:hypothetical protein
MKASYTSHMEKKPIYVRSYDNERKAFRRVLELPDAVFSEFEAALKSLVYQYSTTDYENRFVTGAAVELLVKCLLELAFSHVDSVGGHAKGIDLSSADLRFSVKAQFGTLSDIRLRNIMGSANAGSPSTLGEWNEATVMLIPNVGLVYGDPESSILQAGLYWAKDALIMRKSAILEYIQLNPDYVRPLEVPQNDGVVRQVASTSVVATLLADPQYPLLQKAFMRRKSIDSRIGRLAELEQLLARGAIDQEKFAQLKEQALRD